MSLGTRIPSGCDFHRRVEIHLSGRAPRNDGSVPWPWRAQPVFPHASQVKLNRHLHAPESDIDGFSGRDTTR
jgi:hypothetical protein